MSPRGIEVLAWRPEIPGWDDEAGPDWRDLALCAETDPEAFFPGRGESSRPAKQVCRKCGVREQCLEYALENRERFGIWGGLSEWQRRPLLAARQARELAA